MSIKSRKLEKRIESVKLPTDKELFPELFDGTAKSGMSSVFEDLIDPCTDYDSFPSKVKESYGDLVSNLLDHIGKEVDCRLEDDLLANGARTDAPAEKKYLAFGMRMESESSPDAVRKERRYTYYSRSDCKQSLSERDKYYLDAAEDVFGKYAEQKMDSLDEMWDTLTVEQPGYGLLLVPAAVAGLYMLIRVIFPDWPNFQKTALFAGILISIIPLLLFFSSLKDYFEDIRAKEKEYTDVYVERIVLAAYRSIRYRKILLKRMNMESKALNKQERRFKIWHKTGSA